MGFRVHTASCALPSAAVVVKVGESAALTAPKGKRLIGDGVWFGVWGKEFWAWGLGFRV